MEAAGYLHTVQNTYECIKKSVCQHEYFHNVMEQQFCRTENKLFLSRKALKKKILPLLEEGKTHTNRHVVDAQGHRITFLRRVLRKELVQKTVIYDILF